MTQIHGLPGTPARALPPPGREDRLLDACRQVEGLFLSRLLAELDRPAFGEGIFDSSGAGRIFTWQRNQALAEEMGRCGELGLADMLYHELRGDHARLAAKPKATNTAAWDAEGVTS
ncbi:MAG: rod-binding protein [Armatimonadota bacterium]